MGKLSRTKGHRWERDLVHLFRDAMGGAVIKHGFQSRHGGDAADVDMPVFWLEAKVGKKPNIRAALAHATSAAVGSNRTPLAVVKEDRQAPIAAMYLEDFLLFVRQWWEGRKQ